MDASAVADMEGAVLSGALVALVAGLAVRLARPRLLDRVRADLGAIALPLAAAVAVLATAGSLWFSDSAGFPPCKLCWYQRIAMYPLALLLTAAALRRDGFRLYGTLLAGAGLAVSAYHNVIETFPSIHAGGCDPTNPCTIRWVQGLGFWTIPRMAAACFVLVIVLLHVAAPKGDR